MQTPSSLRVVLTQVRLPEAPADDRPGTEEALLERPTKEAGASSESGSEGICVSDGPNLAVGTSNVGSLPENRSECLRERRLKEVRLDYRWKGRQDTLADLRDRF
jgi:hypothetical protein